METYRRRIDNDRLMAWIGLSLAVFCIFAFALKGVIEPERLSRYNPMVMIHGLLMMCWLALFSLQSWLMSDGAFARHYLFGRLSFVLVVLIIWSSTLIAIQYTYDFQNTRRLSLNSMSLLRFAILYGVAIVCVLKAYTGLHRRLMLLATLILVAPAIGHFTDALGLPEAYETFSGMGVSIILLIMFDLGSGGIRRTTPLLILGAVLLEIAAMAFALGFLQGALAEIMLAV